MTEGINEEEAARFLNQVDQASGVNQIKPAVNGLFKL